MEKRDGLTKGLAIAGAVLALFPALLPIVLSVMLVLQSGVLHLDYLAPAEVFPVAFIGWCLMLWAALRARARRRLISWTFGIGVAALIASQVLAIVSGLASGKTVPAGASWALVLVLLVVYLSAVLVMGVVGVLLLLDLFKAPKPPPLGG